MIPFLGFFVVKCESRLAFPSSNPSHRLQRNWEQFRRHGCFFLTFHKPVNVHSNSHADDWGYFPLHRYACARSRLSGPKLALTKKKNHISHSASQSISCVRSFPTASCYLLRFKQLSPPQLLLWTRNFNINWSVVQWKQLHGPGLLHSPGGREGGSVGGRLACRLLAPWFQRVRLWCWTATQASCGRQNVKQIGGVQRRGALWPLVVISTEKAPHFVRKNLVDLCWATCEQREGESGRHTGRHPTSSCLHQQKNRSESEMINPSHFSPVNWGLMTWHNNFCFIFNAFCETCSEVKTCSCSHTKDNNVNLLPGLMMF